MLFSPEGTSRTVTASGGDSYRWLDANNVEMSATSTVTFVDEGDYMLIATIGNCQVTRPITVEYLDTFRVPNVITINGDGINDQWIIPNSYSNDPDINVIIYNEKGEEVYNVFDYQTTGPSLQRPFQTRIWSFSIRSEIQGKC